MESRKFWVKIEDEISVKYNIGQDEKQNYDKACTTP
jgi:hypothetical protein